MNKNSICSLDSKRNKKRRKEHLVLVNNIHDQGMEKKRRQVYIKSKSKIKLVQTQIERNASSSPEASYFFCTHFHVVMLLTFIPVCLSDTEQFQANILLDFSFGRKRE